MDKSSIPKTAFNSPFSKYEYIKVTFWTCTGSSIFQELMTGILKDFDFAIAHLDDIIIFSRTAKEHLSHIKQVFMKLHAAKLSMKLSKCHFFSRDSIFRTHSKLIQPLPLKTQAIQNMHPPKTLKQICVSLA